MKKVIKMSVLALFSAGLALTSLFTGCHKSADSKEILVVSFGTSYNSSRDLTIGGIENAIAAAFPEYKVERAFTADTIIKILKERDNLTIDNVEEALEKAANKGVKTLVVQPTHLMDGFEYTDLKKVLSKYENKFSKVVLSKPLLSSDADFDAVATAITKDTAKYDDGNTAICFMGHGTEAPSNGVYAKMQEVLTAKGFANYYVGTVEAKPGVEDLITAIKAKNSYKGVVLHPLMVVAGDHANNDMAGDDEDSWKSGFEKDGSFESIECQIAGLGGISEVQEVYVSHTGDVIK